jgi:hypothetical protein
MQNLFKQAHYFIWKLAFLVHSHHFTWQQSVQHLLLFQSAVSQNAHVWVQCTAIKCRFFFPMTFKEGVRIFFPLACRYKSFPTDMIFSVHRNFTVKWAISKWLLTAVRYNFPLLPMVLEKTYKSLYKYKFPYNTYISPEIHSKM